MTPALLLCKVSKGTHWLNNNGLSCTQYLPIELLYHSHLLIKQVKQVESSTQYIAADNSYPTLIITVIINFIRTNQYPRAIKIMFYGNESDSQNNAHDKN